MSDFEIFSKDLMESAKSFLEAGDSSPDPFTKQALLRSALFHGFCFLEANINNVAEHYR